MDDIKKQNTKYLKSLGIDVPDHLPVIESLNDVQPRTSNDIAGRLCAISYIIGLGFDAESSELLGQLNEYNLMPYVSDHEKTLLKELEIKDQDKINLTWLSEGAQVLAWCIDLVELDHSRHCDDDLAQKIPFKFDPTDFINKARLRPIEEIQIQADLLYRLHWHVRNCRLTGLQSKFKESIISERRKAIDWAYGVAEDWDQIPMDT